MGDADDAEPSAKASPSSLQATAETGESKSSASSDTCSRCSQMMKSCNHLDEEEKLKGNSDTHPIWSLVAMNMPEEGLPEIIMVLLFLFMKHRSVMIFAGAIILEICSFF